MTPETVEFFKHLYYHEIERKEKVRAALGLPLALMSAVMGIIAYYFKSFKWSNMGANPIPEVFFIGFFVVLLIAFAFTGYYFVQAFWSRTYANIFLPSTFLMYLRNIEKHWKDKPFAKAKADADWNSELVRIYSEFAEQNTLTNDDRYGYIHRLNIAILFAMLFAGLAWLPLFLSGHLGPEVQLVHIVSKT